MIPSPFEYELAESVDHALDLVGGFGDDAKFLAGGHSLLPLMKLRLAQPSALVDIGRLSELSYVKEDGDKIAIGSLTTHEDVESSDVLKNHCPLVAYTAGIVGDPQVRHRGTIGGSVAHGDPASDLPTVLLTVDAELVVQGAKGKRTVAARDFFKSLFEVDLSPREMLTEIRVPKLDGAGWSYQKFHAREQDWAVVGVAAVLPSSNSGTAAAAVGLTTMGATPLRAASVEAALRAGASIEEAAQEADRDTSPPSDPMGSAEYRREIAKILTRRALEEAQLAR